MQNLRNKNIHEICCKVPTVFCPCPVCGNVGRKVSALTLDNHVPRHLRIGLGEQATFCLNPLCEVVYCADNGKIIRKGETVLPVTIKDPGDDVFVCYCFEVRRGDIHKELLERGKTDIPARIKKNLQEGRCNCERKNPQGACCLGNMFDVIKAIQAKLKLS